MILIHRFAIWPPIPKIIFIKHCWVEIIVFPFVFFHRDRFFNFCCLFRQRFFAAYLLKLFFLPQRVHTTLFIRCDKPELTRWCLCSLHAGIQMSPDEVVGSRDSYRHSIAESTDDDAHTSLLAKISVLAPRCSRALLHNLQVTSDRCLVFGRHLATGMISAIAIISHLLCLQGTRGSFIYFPKNALLSFGSNMKSAVHVPYAG